MSNGGLKRGIVTALAPATEYIVKAGVVGHDTCPVAEDQYGCAASVLGDVTLCLAVVSV